MAQLAISQFQYQKAYNLYHQLHLAFPFDLNIKSEYIFILHHLGLTIELKTQVDLFVDHWEKLTTDLIPDYFKAGILIAKINEELGRFDQGFKILEKCNTCELSAYQKQAVFLQMMRIAIELNLRDFIDSNYHDLDKGMTFNKDFLIEREHILLLADYYFGEKIQKSSRIENLKHLKMNKVDQIFINSEILEHQLVNKLEIDHHLLNIPIDDSLIYEFNQKKLFQHKMNNIGTGLINYFELQKKLSPMLIIRLIRQNILLFPNDIQIEYLVNTYQILCSQIKPKEVAQYYLSYAPHQKLTELIFKATRMSLISQNKESSIQTETNQKYIQLFSNDQKSFDLVEVAQYIYNEKYNSHHYDRIRIAVSRLNRQIHNDLMISQLFKINKNQLSITMNIKKEVG